MNSLLSTPLVPEKEVYPVCTNGLQTGTMVVTSQNKMCNAKRHYIATYLDKPTDFKCVYAGILVAFVIGVIVGILAMSIASFGTGAVIAGILVATLVGIIASYGLGGAVCRYCLESAVWDKFHPNIIIDGKFAIIGSSKLICTPPLPLLTTPGAIQIFYDKDVANKTAEIYATQNVLRIFKHALLGYSIPGIFKYIGGLLTNGLTVANVIQLGGGTMISIGKDYAEDRISDVLSNTNSNYSPNIEIEGVIDNASMIKDVQMAKGNVMKSSWIKIKADPSYYKGMSGKELNQLKSRYMKGAWADKKTAKKNSKTALSVLGLDFLGNTIGKTIYKCMAKGLEEWREDAESTAIANIGIYEKQI